MNSARLNKIRLIWHFVELRTFNALESIKTPCSIYVSKKIIQNSNGYNEEWNYPPDSFYLVSTPILKDAYDILIYRKQSRIRECQNCGWLFYDSSKNGSRRWCSMTTCGSNVKAPSWYYKHKTTDL